MTETPKAPAHVGQIIKWDPVLADLTLNQPERRGFTVNDQLERLLEASDLTSEFGVMHQVLALCALPRTNPGEERQYRRDNGWWTLYMTATGRPGLPYGSYPRLLLAWVSTEAVRTRSPALSLGDSLAGFMRTLGVFTARAPGRVGIRTHLRDQMYRLFNTSIRLDTRQRDRRQRHGTRQRVVAGRQPYRILVGARRHGERADRTGEDPARPRPFREPPGSPRPRRPPDPAGPPEKLAGDRPLPVAQLRGLQASRPERRDLATALQAVRQPPVADLRPAGRYKTSGKAPSASSRRSRWHGPSSASKSSSAEAAPTAEGRRGGSGSILRRRKSSRGHAPGDSLSSPVVSSRPPEVFHSRTTWKYLLGSNYL